MQDVQKKLEELYRSIKAVYAGLGIDALISERDKLTLDSQAADFWSDSKRAKEHMKRIADLQNRIATWVGMRRSAQDLVELAGMDDHTLAEDITAQYEALQKRFNAVKDELKFNSPYDDGNAIMSIYAGAGGTDAQDWAGMLQRMYLRWAETHQYETEIIDLSSGDEAGIKSTTMRIIGTHAYGKLQSEHGVHRLVRLSPFNADNLRQTSFAKVDVLPEVTKPDDEQIEESALKIDVYRAGGHGGQSVNTTDSAVRVTHIPTGITVAIQNERSQLQNKETALTILRSRLAQLRLEQHKEKIADLKGPNQSAEWGNQIRSYVLHPYKQVKDMRSKYETSDVQKVLDGGSELDKLMSAYLESRLNAT